MVRDRAERALYFSRAPIPWHREAFTAGRSELPEDMIYYRHLGIYAYRVAYLLDFVGSGTTPIERVESLEQLRTLYQGGRITVAEGVAKSGPGVDTEKESDQGP